MNLYKKRLLIRFLYLVIFVSIIFARFQYVQALQANAHNPKWSIPDLDCETTDCEMRLSPQGTLYTYDPHTWTLYISSPDGATYTTFDLSAGAAMIGDFIDFVPFDESHQIIFYSTTGSATLSRYDTTTRQMKALDFGISDPIVGCNYYTIFRYIISFYVSRLGLNNQLLVCSYSQDTVFKIHIVDVISQKIIHSLEFEDVSREGIILRPWNVIWGGQDGNIYIETNSLKYWPELTANPDNISSGVWFIFKYSINTNTWTMKVDSLATMDCSNFPHHISTITWPVATDPIGNSYYYHEWGSNVNGKINRHMAFT
ncbi:MAG TPA: hypothetical protein VHO69_14570, partial [Phototrophicaceae bacterium]|nr:hypothetical protein [Phototrophicaceae bacterium]